MAAVRFELRALGPLQLVDVDGRSVESALAQSKRVALLSYLSAAPPHTSRSRDTLVALFWPEATNSAARNALNQALFFIRHALSDDCLVTLSNGDVDVDPHVLRCDVREFENFLECGREEDAVTLYRGPFLAGFHITGTSDFTQWVEEERSRLSSRYVAALEHLASTSQSAADFTRAVAWWRMALAVDPLNTRVTASLMLCLVKQGFRTEALKQSSIHARLLRDQLELGPDPEIVAIENDIKNGHAQASSTIEFDRQPVMDPQQPITKADRAFRRLLRRPTRLISYSVIVIVVAASLAAFVRSRDALVDDRVVVAAFANRTNDPSVDELGSLAADYIADGLVRSRAVHVVDPGTAFYAIRGAPGAHFDLSDMNDLKTLAHSVHAAIVVWGAIYQAADSLIYEVRVSSAANGELLDQLRFARPKIEARTVGIVELRERIGGLIASRLDVDLSSLGGGQLAPARLDAYEQYVQGMADFQGMHYREALSEFLVASKLDSTFFLPMSMAIYAAGNGGAPRRVRDSLIEAMLPQRARMSPLERLAIDMHRWRGKDIGNFREAVEEAARLAPGSNFSFEQGLVENLMLNPRAAIQSFDLVDRDRGWARGWVHVDVQLANALHMRGDYRRELTVAREGIARAKADRRPANIPWMQGIEVQALAGLGDTTRLQEVLAEPMTEEDRFDLLWVAGQALLYHGFRSLGENLISRDEQYLRATGDSASDSWYWGTMAFLAYHRWDPEAVRHAALEQLRIDAHAKRPTSGEMLRYLAIVEAAIGAQDAAQGYLVRLRSIYKKDEPTLLFAEAAMAGAIGNAGEAASLLRQCVSSGGIGGYRGPLLLVMDPAFRRIKDDGALQALFRGESRL